MQTVENPLAGTVVVVTFVVIAALLFVVLIGSTVRQQRRYLRTRQHLGGRLLTAQDEERAAIARDLHDDVVQRIMACATRLHLVNDPAANAITEDLSHVAEDLRGLARGIHPAIVEQVGISAALGDLCKSFADREGVTVDFVGLPTRDQLTPNLRLALYRVTQEALGNVARHAGTDRASVRLSGDARRTVLVIEDHGRGFDRRSAETGPGIGVTSMSERLAILGGALELVSSPGQGTRITATVPQPAATA